METLLVISLCFNVLLFLALCILAVFYFQVNRMLNETLLKLIKPTEKKTYTLDRNGK